MVNNYNSFSLTSDLKSIEISETTDMITVKDDVIQQILSFSASLEVLNSEVLDDVFIIKN
jgi:hypothetical protein